jgi:hypothetical protein
MANKIIDINPYGGGKASKANQLLLMDDAKEYLKKYKPLRSPVLKLVPNVFKSFEVSKASELILKQYKFAGIEFGNWVNQYRRIDFCFNLYTALFDLNKVLKFNNNIGFNKSIYVAYGARGAQKALAHYEPLNKVINLSRDRRLDKDDVDFFTGVQRSPFAQKPSEYLSTQSKFREHKSGYGSFAHEYGHAIDYIVAEKYTTRNRPLTGGKVILTNPKYKTAYSNFLKAINTGNSKIEMLFLNCFEPLLFTKDKPTGFYKRLYVYTLLNGTYFSQLNEIWARTFEVYVAYKLQKQGITNKFLVKEGKGKYRDEVGSAGYKHIYPSFGEIAKISKEIDAFIAEIAKKI